MNKVWKLQRPLFSSEETPRIMAYTQNREDMAMIPLGQELIDEIFGDEPKIYVKATVKNGILKISHPVKEQEW